MKDYNGYEPHPHEYQEQPQIIGGIAPWKIHCQDWARRKLIPFPVDIIWINKGEGPFIDDILIRNSQTSVFNIVMKAIDSEDNRFGEDLDKFVCSIKN